MLQLYILQQIGLFGFGIKSDVLKISQHISELNVEMYFMIY